MKEGGAASNHWPVVERQSFIGDCCRPVVMRIPVPFSKIDDFPQFTNRSLHSAHHKSVVVGLTLLRGSVFNWGKKKKKKSNSQIKTNVSEEVTVTGAQHMVAWSSEEQLSSYCELCRAESFPLSEMASVWFK